MNEKTAKLLERFSNVMGISYASSKKSWQGLNHKQRREARIRMKASLKEAASSIKVRDEALFMPDSQKRRG